MENETLETNYQTTIPPSSTKIFPIRKQTKTHQNISHGQNRMAESLAGCLKTTSSRKKQRRELIERKIKKVGPQKYYNDEEEEEEEEKKEEVERKIEALQRLVPGGESLGVDKLFQETAGYIMFLQSQIKTMKTLATFFEAFEKEKRKFGA